MGVQEFFQCIVAFIDFFFQNFCEYIPLLTPRKICGRPHALSYIPRCSHIGSSNGTMKVDLSILSIYRSTGLLN
jgi:hypothetical protein